MTPPLLAAIIALAPAHGQASPAQDPSAQTPAPGPNASASDVLSACFQHYYNAKSLSGRIHLTLSEQPVANGGAPTTPPPGSMISVDTDLAYDRPSLLYILQRQSNHPKRWLAVSDGRTFSYDRPEGVRGPLRFQEAVVQPDGRIQEVPEMYAALRKGSLGDPSPVLDIAIANPDVLAGTRAHWGAIHRGGTTTVRDQSANVITGDVLTVPGQPATGSFEIDITPAGDVLRYISRVRYADPGGSGKMVDVFSNYEVDLKVGATNDPKVYRGS